MIKKHVHTVIILCSVLISTVWSNGKFNEIQKQLDKIKACVNRIENINHINEIEKK